MTIHRPRQRGIALVYVGVFLVMLALLVGLATDLGRAYAVRLDMAKAVDAAALAAARIVPTGESAARTEARNIFRLNFPDGHLGVSAITTPDVQFSRVASGPDTGAYLINVSATASLPTTFMNFAGKTGIDVPVGGQATRRLVDMAFVIDHSGSLGGAYPQVRTAANQFVDFFDPANDRISLIMYGSDTVIADQIFVNSRGFDKNSIKNHITNSSSIGKTATAEALYRGWDQLRRVPADVQSGLRVVVLFSDGVPNTFTGRFRIRTSDSGSASLSSTIPIGGIHADDFGSGGGSTSTPVEGLWPAVSACCSTLTAEASCLAATGGCWEADNTSFSPYTSPTLPGIPYLPATSTHQGALSAGIPASFQLFTSGLAGQRTLNTLTGTTLAGYPYPSSLRNTSNAARNLAERIANDIRSDGSGAHPIHIFALGLGAQLTTNIGPTAETGNSILMRIANDIDSPHYNSSQPEGYYYFAGSATELNNAFQQIRDQIIRISQ
jgi:Flp pilus assembly protein TadG